MVVVQRLHEAELCGALDIALSAAPSISICENPGMELCTKSHVNPDNLVNPVKHVFLVRRFYRIYRIGHDLHDEHGGTFHYRLNGADSQTDTLEWTSRRFFNGLGSEGWELVSAILKDKEWSPGGMVRL